MSPLTTDDFDVMAIREDFPCLQQQVNGHDLVYLDNAASSQTPTVVVDAITQFYLRDRANVHRGVHTLSQRATASYDAVRGKARAFLNAREEAEIVFTGGTTDGINLVAWTYDSFVGPGDEIVVTEMEHHSDIVPWQLLCERTGATLRVLPINEAGELVMSEVRQIINAKTSLVAVVHISNALGTINPVEEIAALAHAHGAKILVDAAQSAPHLPLDVVAMDVDFLVLSAHKICGPTGVGILYGRRELLEALPPWRGGGDMIDRVTFDKTTWNEVPFKFEAGTPNIAGVIGMGAAIDYLLGIGMDRIATYEADLFRYALRTLGRIPQVKRIGTAERSAGVFSFVIDGVHPSDMGMILDNYGIAIRTGHHCAQPVMDHYNVCSTARASFAFYNTKADVDALAQGLEKAIQFFT